jgi:hypothetical protein
MPAIESMMMDGLLNALIPGRLIGPARNRPGRA